MNPWATLVGDTVPREIRGLPVRKHILADEIDYSALKPAPALADASISEVAGPKPKRGRLRTRTQRAVNHWPLIGSATAAEIKAAADRAWGRIGGQ